MMIIDNEMVKFMHPLFGEMADKTIELQKKKLGIEDGPLSYDEYARLIEAIGNLCRNMAGEAIANRILEGLKNILDKEMNTP